MEFLLGRGRKFYEFATKISELIWINLLTLLCCIPVITVGSAITAMNHVVFAIYSDEDEKITRMFFRAFCINFAKATKLGLLYTGFFAFLLLEKCIMKVLENPHLQYLDILIPVLGLIGFLSMLWSFVLQFRYELSIKNVLLYSVTRIMAFPFRTLGMGIAVLLPVLLAVFYPQFIIIIVFLGITGPAVLCACFYNGAFKSMEEVPEEQKA